MYFFTTFVLPILVGLVVAVTTFFVHVTMGELLPSLVTFIFNTLICMFVLTVFAITNRIESVVSFTASFVVFSFIIVEIVKHNLNKHQ